MGTIVGQVFPAVKTTCTMDNKQTVSAYRNLSRIVTPRPLCPSNNWVDFLTSEGFLVKTNRQNYTEACYPTKYTLNSVNLYLELKITNDVITMMFNGKIINLDKVLSLNGTVTTNDIPDPKAFLKIIKDLRPCTGYTSRASNPNLWGIVGQAETAGQEATNSAPCVTLLPLNMRSNTSRCDACRYAKHIHLQQMQQLEESQNEDESTVTCTQKEHQEIIDVMEKIKNFSCLTEEQKTFIGSQLDRCRTVDARLYRWDRR